jgi:glyoxylase-like metal-dependent hydrolase (beta-lactamase superfamily II)
MTESPAYLHCITVPTPFPVGPVNLYLAERDPLTLIDTGPRFEPAREALSAGLASLGYTTADIGRIVLTHSHSDHCGLAAEIQAASGAEVLTHPSNFDELADYAAQRTSRLAFYAALMIEAAVPPQVVLQINRMRKGYGRYARAVRPDGPLGDGASLSLGGEDWRVLHTPGHTGGLVCLFNPERRVLLSSDHLLRDISSNPIVEPPERQGDGRPRRLLDYITQLRRVAQQPVALALPGHGPPITDIQKLIAERLAFHEKRARRIVEVLGAEERTVYAIALALFPQLDPINRFLALSEVIGHLDWLEARGEVGSRMQGRARLWSTCRPS